MNNENIKDSRDSEIVKKIRHKVGMTQAAIAQALGVSIRAIQSYEQGWRDVPTHIMVQLLVLAAAYHTKGERKSCWEIRGCSPEAKANCPCCKTDGKLCWLVSGRKCSPVSEGHNNLEACMDCAVVHQILK
jgi:DNA-binding XRE family transcriptional regulator